MENNDNNLIETLIERATEYGKNSLELFKLKALDKTLELVSLVVPNTIVFLSISTFMLFLNFGLALWIGELLGKIYYGFFVMAGFYIFIALVLHFIFRKMMSRGVSNYILRKVLK